MLRTIKHVKKNDVVKILTGSDKGKTGKILRVINKTGKVVVEKVNVRKRHRKATGKQPGGIIEQEGPIHASNVMLMSSGQKADHKTEKKAEKKTDKKEKKADK